MKIDYLIEEYESIYQEQIRDFNALSTIHLSENDHTNILCEILNMKIEGQKLFMRSFIEDVLGIKIDNSDNYVNYVAKTQVPAMPSASEKDKKKNYGFIDLLIEYEKDTKIIVENKVCGAGDGQDQLARYYFTYKKDVNIPDYYEEYNSWKEWLSNNNTKIIQNVYIVYLTDFSHEDETIVDDSEGKHTREHPSKKSINDKLLKYLKERNEYIQISYEEHIYDWLKNIVLPKIQYGKTGDAHNSIILYLRELENILGANNSKNELYLSQKEHIEQILSKQIEIQKKVKESVNQELDPNTDVYSYYYWSVIYNIVDTKLKEDDYKENVILYDLRDCILCYRDSIYGKYAPNGWRVYCAPGYITFYPLYWLEKFGGSKTSCVHFAIDNWSKKNPTIVLKIHGSACKKYIVKGEDTFNARVSKKELGQFGMLTILNECDDFDIALAKFQKSNHYYFNVEIDLKKIDQTLKWEPNNQASDNNFFSKFIESDTIKQLVKYIDDNFK